ncbi:DNA methyltransferase [Afipia sp. P52-10]|uniref:DNA adenine methylase n=1 Tax=Afipia sp. P52-10 TaxID=1429916 RepID=UPI0003DF033C|nr:DNA adenine methylase [Afipia sp. P52-10]ETR75059.1 DNA methyltransferase [Afipia sp. P52-10]
MTAPTRPVLRWHGSKWKIAPWVIDHFPQHRVYVEPFGGSGAVLLRKPRANTEIYNDRDGDVVNLFRVLRERPDALSRALSLTPFSRDEYDSLYETIEDPLERAWALVARSFMGMNSKGALEKSGFDTRVNPDGFISRLRSLIAVPDEIAAVALRFAHVVVENDDALRVIERFDRQDALIYCDPPYALETRSGKYYRHELSNSAHRKLIEKLRTANGMVVLSGYATAQYDDALADWRRVQTDALTDGAARRVETLWINPACAAALDREGKAAQQLEMMVG